jgi:HD superfamily phosphodiesterase
VNSDDLSKIRNFCKPFYSGTGKWHAWNHAEAVEKLAIKIATSEFPEADLNVVRAASIAHDMGRIVRDEGHAEESARILKPFLDEIDIDDEIKDKILDAVASHDVNKIEAAKHLEARIVYDADKIEILSVYGFMRVWFWLIEERKMEISEAVQFLEKYCKKFKSTLYSNFAKDFVEQQYPLIEKMLKEFYAYEKKWRL